MNVDSGVTILSQYFTVYWKWYEIIQMLQLNVNRKSQVPSWSMSDPMTLSGEPKRQFFQCVSLYTHLLLFYQQQSNSAWKPKWAGAFVIGQTKGGAPDPQHVIFGATSHLSPHLWCRTTNFGMVTVTHMGIYGDGHVFIVGSHDPSQGGRAWAHVILGMTSY